MMGKGCKRLDAQLCKSLLGLARLPSGFLDTVAVLRRVGRSGFEWLFRLCMEPRRLWKRYGVNYSAFLFHILQQITKLRNYEMAR